MYILQIDREGAPLVQGMIRAQWPSTAALRGGQANAWINMFVRSAALWSQVKLKSAGLRIAIEPGAPVTTIHSFVVDKSEETRLRLLLAAFLRTEGIGSGQAEAPHRGMALDGTFFHSGEPRLTLARETLATAGGLAIYQNVMLADLLPKLLLTLADLAIPFAYEFQAVPWAVPREPLRAALVNASHMTDAEGVPSDLARDQMALAERGRRGTFHFEECLSAPQPHSLPAIRETLANILNGTLYGSYGAAPQIEQVDDQTSEAFAHLAHSHLMFGAPTDLRNDCVTAAATRDDVDRCLSCRLLGLTQGTTTGSGAPEPLAIQLAQASLGTGSADPIGTKPVGSMPNAGASPPTLFVSYARHDSDIVYPLTEALSRDGVRLWVDQRLIGGDDWIAELEQQLTVCRGVLAFVSPAFAASKYCRREVIFADALSKPIIPIVLVPATLSGGLNFILHAVQQIHAPPGGQTAPILAAVQSLMPDVLH